MINILPRLIIIILILNTMTSLTQGLLIKNKILNDKNSLNNSDQPGENELNINHENMQLRNLNYTIDEKNSLINITSFTTDFAPDTSKNTIHDLRNGIIPFRTNNRRRGKMGMVHK